MTLKELRPKYEMLEIYFVNENPGLFETPVIISRDNAIIMYGDRKILHTEDHDERKMTEIMIAR